MSPPPPPWSHPLEKFLPMPLTRIYKKVHVQVELYDPHAVNKMYSKVFNILSFISQVFDCVSCLSAHILLPLLHVLFVECFFPKTERLCWSDLKYYLSSLCHAVLHIFIMSNPAEEWYLYGIHANVSPLQNYDAFRFTVLKWQPFGLFSCIIQEFIVHLCPIVALFVWLNKDWRSISSTWKKMLMAWHGR